MYNFDELLEKDLKKLKDIYKITWLNDQLRQDTVNKIKNGGNTKENFRRAFNRGIKSISKGEGQFFKEDNEEKVIKKELAGAGKLMKIICVIKMTGKHIKIKRYVISEVDIESQYYDPKVLKSSSRHS